MMDTQEQHGALPLAVRPAVSYPADVLGLAGLLFLGAQARIPLPFSPAPFTLQVLVVLIAPYLLGHARACAGIALFIAAGLVGQTAGVGLFSVGSGATLGYLAAFLLAPWLTALFPRTDTGILAAMTCTALMILLLGAFWLQQFLGCSFSHAALIGILPFLPGDLVKVGLAHAIVRHYHKRSNMITN